MRNTLRATRLAKGMTLEEVAEKLGVTARTVSRYERGEQGLSVARLLDFSLLYRTQVWDLFPDFAREFEEDQ